MALLVSLRRRIEEHELGAYSELILTIDELRRAEDDSRIVRHRNNRWYPESGEEWSTLDIIGPLVIKDSTKTMGPYATLSMFDGVAHVDNRVFAFTDVQRRDWYMHDVGEHWNEMRILFQKTGP